MKFTCIYICVCVCIMCTLSMCLETQFSFLYSGRPSLPRAEAQAAKGEFSQGHGDFARWIFGGDIPSAVDNRVLGALFGARTGLC